jgi:CubicO group peptidase (beta-lactamase class C family)
VLALCACGRGARGEEDGGAAVDAGGDAGVDAGVDGGGSAPDGGASAREAAFARAGARVAAAVADAGVSGVSLAVYDAQDRRVYLTTAGDFGPERRVAVASASKWVSAVVLLRLVGAGALSLDSTTGALLGWTGAKGDVTLRHLLSFTSGLTAAPGCTRQLQRTLAECVADIGAAGLTGSPGAQFEYGSGHLHVAARMAEVATGRPWAALFEEQLKAPLGLTHPELAYFTAPRLGVGTSNPLVAGGLRATMDEYARLLAPVFHEGRAGGAVLLAEALLDVQAREPYPAATVRVSPARDLGYPFRYGLGAWLECDTPAAGCDVLSSPGAFGFTPWVDREAGYYAVLGMQLDVTDTEGAAGFALGLAQALQPLLREAMAAPP